MIRREKLLRKIHDVIEIKNTAIPLLDRHISASLTFSKLDPQVLRSIREKFRSWMVLQLKHTEILKEVAEFLRQRGADVF